MRIDAGASRLYRALIDLTGGLYLVASGLALILAIPPVYIASVLAAVLVRLAALLRRNPVAASSRRLPALPSPARRSPGLRFPAIRLGAIRLPRGFARASLRFLLEAAGWLLACAGLYAFDKAWRASPMSTAIPVDPFLLLLAGFIALTVLVLVLRWVFQRLQVIAAYLFAQLLAHADQLMTAALVAAIAGIAGAGIYGVLQAPFLIALLAATALIAGAGSALALSLFSFILARWPVPDWLKKLQPGSARNQTKPPGNLQPAMRQAPRHRARKMQVRTGLGLGLIAVLGAGLYLVLNLPPDITLVSGLALLAGLSGAAIVSLGPSFFSLVRIAGRASVQASHFQAARFQAACQKASHLAGSFRGGSIRFPFRQNSSHPTQGASMSTAARASLPPAAPVASLLSPAGPLETAGDPARLLPDSSWAADPSRRGQRQLTPEMRLFLRDLLLTAMMLILLSGAWLSAGSLWRSLSGTSKPASPAPIASPLPPPARIHPQTPPEALQLYADGVPSDLAWRHGYRNLTVQIIDERPVRKIALPRRACLAPAILVIGAASSDGVPAVNRTLATRRARWLASWTVSQAASCQEGAPAILALSLGQSTQASSSPEQRRIRLALLRPHQLAELAAAANPAVKLRDLAGQAFSDLGAYDDAYACTFTDATKARSLPVTGLPVTGLPVTGLSVAGLPPCLQSSASLHPELK